MKSRTRADAIAESHAPDRIRERLRGPAKQSYLSDFVYGGIDGAVTTFAVVSGVAGAGLSPIVILVLGLANLLGDGFSMAAANFLGIRADHQRLHRVREEERREIELHPEGEIEEVRQIYAAKGLGGETLELVVEAITADRERWVDTMLTEEHGLALEARSPWRAAGMTFVAFFVVGAVPLVPFVFGNTGLDFADAFASSTVLVACSLFGVGALKARFVDQPWWRDGIETLAVGGVAAALAYAVGWSLRGLVG